MHRLRSTAALIAAAIITTAPAVASAGAGRTSTSQVDFGACVELSTGSVSSLAELQARVPSGVSVLSLTEQGFVFTGSDDLGILITRTLDCESISVTRDGRTRTQVDRHIAHIQALRAPERLHDRDRVRRVGVDAAGREVQLARQHEVHARTVVDRAAAAAGCTDDAIRV